MTDSLKLTRYIGKKGLKGTTKGAGLLLSFGGNPRSPTARSGGVSEAELRDFFNAIDEDGSGSLDYTEIQALLAPNETAILLTSPLHPY